MQKVAKFGLAFMVSLVIAGIVYGAASSSPNDAKDKAFQVKEFKFTAEAINMAFVDTNVVTSTGVKISDFPAGVILIHGAVMKDIVVTVTATNEISAASNGDFAIGTTQGTGTDLTTTEANIIPKTAMNTMTNPVTGYLVASTNVDGTSTACDIWLNLMIDADEADAIHTNAMTIAGKLQILYSEMMDY